MRSLSIPIHIAVPRFPITPILPGLGVAVTLAAAATALHQTPGLSIFSPMILALTLGALWRNLIWAPPRVLRIGVAFAMRGVLRLAVVLLGLQLTFEQMREVGPYGLGAIAATLVATFLFTVWLGERLGVERKLAELIAAGSSICGASAVMAANMATGAKEEDAAYAVACVTIFGTLAMFVYPLLPGFLGLDARAYGLWAGASIHEVAQVVAAAFQHSREAGEFGAVAKLSRVLMLAPVVMALGAVAARRLRREGGAEQSARAPAPLFVVGFVVMVGINSVLAIPAGAKTPLVALTTFLLTTALAAMGLETDFAQLRTKGVRPFALGFASSLFVAAFSLLLVKAIP
jgi:uncharacterized integral membrane protein (TIGR00698 family)